LSENLSNLRFFLIGLSPGHNFFNFYSKNLSVHNRVLLSFKVLKAVMMLAGKNISTTFSQRMKTLVPT
jgi:hypothetical protein